MSQEVRVALKSLVRGLIWSSVIDAYWEAISSV